MNYSGVGCGKVLVRGFFLVEFQVCSRTFVYHLCLCSGLLAAGVGVYFLRSCTAISIRSIAAIIIVSWLRFGSVVVLGVWFSWVCWGCFGWVVVSLGVVGVVFSTLGVSLLGGFGLVVVSGVVVVCFVVVGGFVSLVGVVVVGVGWVVACCLAGARVMA